MPYTRFTKAIIHHFMSQHKSIFKREVSPYHTIADDGLLERLKFINKGDLYQVYGKHIPNTWITDEIKESKAYQTKKPSKKKQVLHDESPESKGELENRQVNRKIRTPRAVVIQEPPSVPVKKTQESSGKLKGIKIQRAGRLKHITRSLSEGTGVSPGVPDELTRGSAVLSEGVGTSPKVPDKTVYNYEAQSDDDVWGSTDEDDVNEEEADEEESVDEEESDNKEENVDEENEEESDDDDNKSFDITNTDDERMESDSNDHEMSKEGKTIVETEE
ncbi:hypothetical protein Tco_0105753 [Tanacetum coccineum]